MKVLYITNITVPYRMSFFNELGKKCELTVIIERDSAKNRNKTWLSSIQNQSFKTIYLHAKEFGEESSISFKIIHYLKEDYDLIIIGGYSTITSMISILYLKIKKRRFILNADGGFISNSENKIIKMIKKMFISSATYWITTSEQAKNYFIYYGAISEKIFIYPFSSILNDDIQLTSIEEKNKIRKDLGFSLSKKIIISVGQIIPRKGYKTLLKASKYIMREHVIVIIGGHKTEELNAYIIENKMENIKFIEFLDKDKLSKYYKCADCFAFPTNYDVWGLVVNESMSYGLPIIASNAAGASIELVKDGYNGYIFESGNYIDLAEKTNYLFDNIGSYNQIIYNCLETAKKYTIETMANTHISIFHKILEQGEY